MKRYTKVDGSEHDIAPVRRAVNPTLWLFCVILAIPSGTFTTAEHLLGWLGLAPDLVT